MINGDRKKRLSGRFISILAVLMVIFSTDLPSVVMPYYAYAQDITYYENESDASAELKEDMKARKSSSAAGIKGKTNQEGLQQVIGELIEKATEVLEAAKSGSVMNFGASGDVKTSELPVSGAKTGNRQEDQHNPEDNDHQG